MFRIKRLHTFLLQTFAPVLFMTFFICLFIILMQFLWKYVDEMVGKGIEMVVLAEFFFYAGLTLIPMALPLAVLLASLMTFGNLGERLELLAMKSSGISLFQIMKPIIILMICVSIGAFYFQNVISPHAQVKLYALMFSLRQKSPELDIPEGSFYDKINGMNLFISKKNKTDGTLYDMMIYDYSEGFDNASVTVADSGTIKMSSDKKALLLTLYNGESFSNLSNQRPRHGHVPFQKESFSLKELVMEFDANFNRMDDGFLQNQYIAKDIKALEHTIDSVTGQIDSLHQRNSEIVINMGYLDRRPLFHPEDKRDSILRLEFSTTKTIDLDSLYNRIGRDRITSMLTNAQMRAERVKQDYDFKQIDVKNKNTVIRTHKLEWHKKFTLSFACMVFFFIGAPLGAIIRKGGIGMPAVISVFLFICYFIIDNTGSNLAKEQVFPPFAGMWLSSFILLPLGVFFTYKAVNDSVIMNADTYLQLFKALRGRVKRTFERPEIIMDPTSKTELYDLAFGLYQLADKYNETPNNGFINDYKNYWLSADKEVEEINRILEERLVPMLRNYEDKLISVKQVELPVLMMDRYSNPVSEQVIWMRNSLYFVFPIGVIPFLFSRFAKRSIIKDVNKIKMVSLDIIKQIKDT